MPGMCIWRECGVLSSESPPWKSGLYIKAHDGSSMRQVPVGIFLHLDKEQKELHAPKLPESLEHCSFYQLVVLTHFTDIWYIYADI